jgi:hypothetical protein
MFDWRDFLTLAQSLADQGEEAARRSSVSRAYYYAFNWMLVEARTLGFRGTPPSLHSKLWAWLQSHPDRSMREIGVIGRRMHSPRIIADYDSAPLPNQAAAQQLESARQMDTRLAAGQ